MLDLVQTNCLHSYRDSLTIPGGILNAIQAWSKARGCKSSPGAILPRRLELGEMPVWTALAKISALMAAKDTPSSEDSDPSMAQGMLAFQGETQTLFGQVGQNLSLRDNSRRRCQEQGQHSHLPPT